MRKKVKSPGVRCIISAQSILPVWLSGNQSLAPEVFCARPAEECRTTMNPSLPQLDIVDFQLSSECSFCLHSPPLCWTGDMRWRQADQWRAALARSVTVDDHKNTSGHRVESGLGPALLAPIAAASRVPTRIEPVNCALQDVGSRWTCWLLFRRKISTTKEGVVISSSRSCHERYGRRLIVADPDGQANRDFARDRAALKSQTIAWRFRGHPPFLSAEIQHAICLLAVVESGGRTRSLL